MRVQDAGQMSDVPGGEPQGLDLGQFGVCGNVRDELAQLRKRCVHARAAPPLRSRLSSAAARALPRTHRDPVTGPFVNRSAPVHLKVLGSFSARLGSAMMKMMMMVILVTARPER